MPVIGKFSLNNEEKFNRAIFGSMGREGKLSGGVGENASDEAKISEYDKLGGLIMEGQLKVETGSFYDFKKQVPRSEPVIAYAYRDIDGEAVSVSEGDKDTMGLRPDVGSVSKKGKKKAKKSE